MPPFLLETQKGCGRKMDWIKVTIATTAAGIEPVSGRLYQLGIQGLEICDKDDFADFLENNRKYWDYVDEELERLREAETTVTLYVSAEASGREQLTAVRDSMAQLKKLDAAQEYGTLAITLENMRDEDWSENWKQFFHPIAVGEKILIQPEWQPEENPNGRTVFCINPGMSFGTGSHISTRFCIEEMEKCLTGGEQILDLGCGSGILSVIGLLLGAENADAVDIDSNAVDAAYDNLKRNHLSRERYHVVAGDILTDSKLRKQYGGGKYDIVLANIVADVIIALSGFVKEFMKKDGTFICSGIIAERTDEVAGVLRGNGLKIENIRTDEDWSVIVCSYGE